jgi:dTDP-4-dehydrorhamnose reductase
MVYIYPINASLLALNSLLLPMSCCSKGAIIELMQDTSYVIIGANGQLGRALTILFPGARALTSRELDITNKTAIESYDWSGVSHIFNAAAYTNVDGAETQEGRRAAWAINADGVANLAAVATQHDATLVHISSDYVFDGTIDNHLEDEGFAPLGVYGASKAAGDVSASLTPKFYLIRTSWVIGDGKNFVRTMLELGKKGVSPTVVADQIGRLTFTSEIALAIKHLLTTGAPYGTYNLSSEGDPTSWADITREIFKLAGFDLTVTNTTTTEYFAGKEGVAPRPLQSTLNIAKLKSTGFSPADWHDSLAAYLQSQS